MAKKKILMLNGYRTVLVPDHPRAMHGNSFGGYVYEHILVAEKMMKRPLRKKECVHHLDGNRSNNRMENLLVLENSQHAKLHTFLSQNGTSISEKNRVEGVNSGKSKAKNPTYCPCGNTLQYGQGNMRLL